MNISLLGIDIAKNIFQLHGVNSAGQGVLKKRISRDKLAAFVANLSACTKEIPISVPTYSSSVSICD